MCFPQHHCRSDNMCCLFYIPPFFDFVCAWLLSCGLFVWWFSISLFFFCLFLRGYWCSLTSCLCPLFGFLRFSLTLLLVHITEARPVSFRGGFVSVMEEEGVLRLDLDFGTGDAVSTKCFIGKVYSNKQFNAYCFLEVMKRAMASARGFDAREIRKNLFSFQFNSKENMRAVLAREPWHFDKNVVMLQELERGSQPLTIDLKYAAFWARIYDLPMVARNTGSITLIAGKIGDMVEIDSPSLEGFGRSVRVKIKINLNKPLKNGIYLEIPRGKKLWINFKYERLPSFCYFCGTLGHMRKEYDLVDGSKLMENILDTKFPFGEWMRASPGKKALISMEEHTPIRENTSMRQQLFEKFKESVTKDDANSSEEMGRGTKGTTIHRQEEDVIYAQLEMIGLKWKKFMKKLRKHNT
ncbi:hypothetical protein ACS0TY_010797 [Phlomoides rotata]